MVGGEPVAVETTDSSTVGQDADSLETALAAQGITVEVAAITLSEFSATAPGGGGSDLGTGTLVAIAAATVAVRAADAAAAVAVGTADYSTIWVV